MVNAYEDLPQEAISERYGEYRLIRPNAEKQMLTSLQRYGQISPVVVSKSKGGLFDLVDGFKRLRASRQIAKMNTLRAHVLPLNTRAAKAAVLYLNWGSRSVSDLEEGWVIHALCSEDGLTQVEVGALLGRDKSWVSRRLSLVQRLSEEVQEQIRLGLLSGTAGRELARLPRGNQNDVLKAIETHRLCSREVSSLVKVLLSEEPSQRRPLLSDPRGALRRHGKWYQLQRDERLSGAGNRLFRDLGTMDRASRRIVAQVGCLGMQSLPPGDVHILSQMMIRTHHAGRQAVLVLEEAMSASNEERDGVE